MYFWKASRNPQYKMSSHGKFPKWIDGDFFKKVLKSAEGDKDFAVSNFQLSFGSNSAEHYASTVLKAHVEFTSLSTKAGAKHMVIKLIEAKTNALTDAGAFETEIKMYLSTIPEIEKALEGEKFAPKLLYYAKEPVPVIVLEDVNRLGYELHNQPLNLADTKVVCAKIAKFHAASMSTVATGFNETGLFQLKANDGLKFMQNNVELFIDELKTWKNCEVYVTKFEKFHSNFMQKGRMIYESANAAYKVLNHGDFHHNNMLFRRGANGNLDVLFIDFQLSTLATPAIDVFYLLYMIASLETREQHREEILQYYFQVFQDAALQTRSLNGRMPSKLDFQGELLRNGFLEIVIAVCFLPFFFADQIRVQANEIFGNDMFAINARKRLYALPDYRRMMEAMMPAFLHKGFFD